MVGDFVGSSTGADEKSGQLRSGAVHARHLVFFVVAAAAPLTVLAGFGPYAYRIGGEITPSGYLLAGVVYALFAVGFTAMSRHVRNAGAFYAYISQGLGPSIGAGAALTAYVAYTLGEIGFGAAAGLFASTTISDFTGIQIPWGVSAVVIGVLVSIVAYRRVEAGARLLAVLLIGEISILLVLTAAIFLKGPPDGYSFSGFSPANWSWSTLGPLFIITFVVYLGFEQTAVYSEEVSDPARTVPRATYIAVALLAVIYTFVSWVILMGIGPSKLADALANDPDALVFRINTEYAGAFMTHVMEVLIVTSFIAGVLALHNAGARYLFSLGRDGLLPSRLATTGSETASPSVAVIVQSVIVVGALVAFSRTDLDPYVEIVNWTNTPTLVGIMFLQILTSLAVITFFAKDHRGENLWRRLIAPVLSSAALIGVFWLICAKMDLLTSLGATGNVLINLPLVIAFIGGVLRARWLRESNPAAWKGIGHSE